MNNINNINKFASKLKSNYNGNLTLLNTLNKGTDKELVDHIVGYLSSIERLFSKMDIKYDLKFNTKGYPSRIESVHYVENCINTEFFSNPLKVKRLYEVKNRLAPKKEIVLPVKQSLPINVTRMIEETDFESKLAKLKEARFGYKKHTNLIGKLIAVENEEYLEKFKIKMLKQVEPYVNLPYVPNDINKIKEFQEFCFAGIIIDEVDDYVFVRAKSSYRVYSGTEIYILPKYGVEKFLIPSTDESIDALHFTVSRKLKYLINMSETSPKEFYDRGDYVMEENFDKFALKFLESEYNYKKYVLKKQV